MSQILRRTKVGGSKHGRRLRAAGAQTDMIGEAHPDRRLLASERKQLSDIDVARAGGWRTITVMQ